MEEKTLRQLRDASPFAPFQIHFVDGKSVTIISADYLYFLPATTEFMAVKSDGGFRIADFDHVCSIDRNPDLPESY